MEKWKTILAMLALVLIGFIGGFFTHQMVTKKFVEGIIEKGPRPLEDMLIRSLDLTEEQREKLHPIVHEHHQRIRQMHRDMREQRRAVYESLHEALADDLTEEQKEKLKEITTRHQRFHKRNRKNRHQREKMHQ